MKKKLALGLVTCLGAIIGTKEASTNISAEIGSWGASQVTSNNNVINGVSGAAGAAGAYAGAWIGATYGSALGPVGTIGGAIIGAGIGAF